MRLLAIMSVIALAITACGTDDDLVTTDDPTATPPPTETETEVDTDPAEDPTPAEDTTPTEDTDVADDASPDEEPATTAGAEPIITAADTTVDEGSASFTAEVDLDRPEGTDTFTSGGDIDFAGDRRQAAFTTTAGDVIALTTQEGILLALGEGTGWFRVDPRELRGTPAEAFGLATLPLQDPSLNLALLRGTTDDVTEVGEEDIDGDAVTRYAITVDAEQAAAQADGQTRDAITELAGAQATIPMEVWIDEDDRIRRIQHETDLAESEIIEGQPEGSVQVTIDFADFGTDVEIADPDEGEITDIDEQTLRLLISQVSAG